MPLDMLHGEIRPIIKDKKVCKSKLENYRPIMNSSVFLKVFEYLLLPILQKYLAPSKQQVGFTPHSSCANAVTLLKEIIHNYNSDGSEVFCAFVDLCKAFDNIDHEILIGKLSRTNLPRLLVNILSAMLRNTYAHVKFDNVKGNPWRITSGTRQGGILSPLLFNFYLKSLVEDITKLDIGCRLDFLRFNIILYADDIILLAPSRNGLQILLNKLYDCLSEIKLEVNPLKSKYMVFRTKKRILPDVPVFYNSVALECVDVFKYLGIVLSSNLNISGDVDRALNAFLRQFNACYHKFNFVDHKVMVYLFKTYASSFYGCETWYNVSNRDRKFHKISVGYHKAVKKIAGLPVWNSNHMACESIGVNIFRHLQAKRMYKFCVSLFCSKNKTINELRYYFTFKSNIKKMIESTFVSDYGISDLFSNDSDAIMSRIDFVELNEPRSYYSG